MEAGKGSALSLDVHGLRADVQSEWSEVVDGLAADFWWFRAGSAATPSLTVSVERREPDLDRFEGLRSAFVTPRNVVYQDAGRTVVEYVGRALTVVDRHTGCAVVQGLDPHLVREATHNFLISRIGEYLDRRGLVRVHALGLAGAQGAVAVALPSGGGKSTLALRALRAGDCRLLSEDCPLLDRHGLVHPFPMRIGINPSDAAEAPEGQALRTLERMEFHTKLALDVEAFADRVERRPQPLRHLVVGSRTLAREARLEPVARHHAVGPLVREAVVGVGVYQGMEFVLQRGWRDVVGKSGTAARRALLAGLALRRAEVWRLWLGRDRDSNWEALQPLLQEHPGSPR